MSEGLVQAAYIVAAVFFIMSLAGLSKQESARAGNYYGITGMAIALFATIFGPYSRRPSVDHYCHGDRWWYWYPLCEES